LPPTDREGPTAGGPGGFADGGRGARSADTPGECGESEARQQTYSRAQAAADLAYYHELKRRASLGTLPAAALIALPLVFLRPWLAVCVAVGVAAGIANMLLSMHGNERLLDRRSVVAFVLSSFVRIGLFGIVPVVLAVRVPSLWTLGCYYVGFFMPLGVSGILVHLRDRRSG